MRWWSILLVLPLAGCLAAPGGDAWPAPKGRGDQAWAVYTDYEGEFRMQAERSPVWTPKAERAEGILVTVNDGTIRTDGYLPHHDTPAFAVDDCGRPLWNWRGPLHPSGDESAHVNFVNTGAPWDVVMLQTLWAFARDELPALEAGTVRLERGTLDLHARAEPRGGWNLQWTRAGAPANQSQWPDDGLGRLQWTGNAPFPDSFGGLHLVAWGNGGEEHECIREPAIPNEQWGRWGPLQDPPIGHSYNDMIQQALDNPLLFEFRAARQLKPDGYIFSAMVTPGGFGPDPQVPPQDAEWVLLFGSAGDTSGMGLMCKVNDLGGETGLDLYRCSDSLGWSMQGQAEAIRPVPVPPPFPFDVVENSRFFELARRWNPETFHPMHFDFHEWEGDQAVIMRIPDAWHGTGVDVNWDARGGYLVRLSGMTYDEFLHPPE